LKIHGDEKNAGPHIGRRSRSFAPGMTCANDYNIIILKHRVQS
jgi:hypothetical protein